MARSIPIALEHRGEPGYHRSLFDTWMTTDGCDTRVHVLVRDAANGPHAGCRLDGLSWVSWYDGATVDDPAGIDIDHLVSLKEAWDSGAWAWTPARRAAYANDLTDRRTLVAVTADANRSKGDRDPSNWLPEDPAVVCRFVGDWVAVKARWAMSMDESEAGRVKNILRDRCPGWQIAVWTAAPS